MHLTRRSFITSSSIAVIGGAFATSACAKPASKEKFEVTLTDAEWKKRLTPAQYRTLRHEATDGANSPYRNEKRAGIYACAGCDLPVYSSKTKFDSGTIWPSFYAAIPKAVRNRNDSTLGFSRIEEHCRRCGGHMGHVFDDGPPPTGKRHCINGTALKFVPGKVV